MNTQSSTMPESFGSRGIAPAIISAFRPLYWSVRRELWENRLVYLAPLAAAAVFLLGFLVSLTGLPHKLRGLPAINPSHVDHTAAMPYELAGGLIMGTAFIVGIFYSLDALYGERRDRSIVFWKSLPVSDVTTVLAKATVPLVILPLLSFVILIVTQLLMLLLSSAVVLGSGLSVAALWRESSFVHFSVMLLYHLVTVHGLWYAPFYGWFLMVSAWSPRAPFIWAFLPPLVIWAVEKMAFNSSHFLAMLVNRLTGPEPSTKPVDNTLMAAMQAMGPWQFFSRPGLWIGLAIAAAFLAAAIRLRRYRGPI
jgi:ABC-2 type transport system permease protein